MTAASALPGLTENLGLDTARIKTHRPQWGKVEISLAGANHQWALQKLWFISSLQTRCRGSPCGAWRA